MKSNGCMLLGLVKAKAVEGLEKVRSKLRKEIFYMVTP